MYDLGPTDEYVIMATDGLWDVVTNQEAVNMIKETKACQTIWHPLACAVNGYGSSACCMLTGSSMHGVHIDYML